jgi:hypothetical protein
LFSPATTLFLPMALRIIYCLTVSLPEYPSFLRTS